MESYFSYYFYCKTSLIHVSENIIVNDIVHFVHLLIKLVLFEFHKSTVLNVFDI